MNGGKMLAEYANLATLHDALAVLVGLKVMTRDEQAKFTRKFMEDRPEFKAAVQQAMNAGLDGTARGKER